MREIELHAKQCSGADTPGWRRGGSSVGGDVADASLLAGLASPGCAGRADQRFVERITCDVADFAAVSGCSGTRSIVLARCLVT